MECADVYVCDIRIVQLLLCFLLFIIIILL
jgi:hypothetical protein